MQFWRPDGEPFPQLEKTGAGTGQRRLLPPRGGDGGDLWHGACGHGTAAVCAAAGDAPGSAQPTAADSSPVTTRRTGPIAGPAAAVKIPVWRAPYVPPAEAAPAASDGRGAVRGAGLRRSQDAIEKWERALVTVHVDGSWEAGPTPWGAVPLCRRGSLYEDAAGGLWYSNARIEGSKLTYPVSPEVAWFHPRDRPGPGRQILSRAGGCIRGPLWLGSTCSLLCGWRSTRRRRRGKTMSRG